MSTVLEERPATTPADPRAPRMSAGSRRTLVHGGFIAIAVLYVGILVIAPLVAIAWQAFKPGLKVLTGR